MRPLRILVVDDFPDAVTALVRVLQLLGQEAHGAGSGHAALAALDAGAVDIGLFDLELPDVSGYELARALRSRPSGSWPYLVALTGWGDADTRSAALAAGFDVHVEKPVDAQRLEEIVAQARTVLQARRPSLA